MILPLKGPIKTSQAPYRALYICINPFKGPYIKMFDFCKGLVGLLSSLQRALTEHIETRV
jgi:hypothetical protein